MATGRIGVTPVLQVRWSKAPSAGTTSLSGLDDNSVSLVYSVGYEAVYRNGVLLSRGNDYTATTGNSITLIDATIAGDIIEVFANELVPLTDAISKGQFTAKGALLSATAASTPAVLTVGSNDQVLTADSSTATGLKWATASSGGMTLLSTTTITTGTLITISSISQAYKNLYIEIIGVSMASNAAELQIYLDSISTSIYGQQLLSGTTAVTRSGTYLRSYYLVNATNTNNAHYITIYNYASTTDNKGCIMTGYVVNQASNKTGTFTGAGIDGTGAIDSIQLSWDNAENFDAGTVRIYGVN